MSQCLQRRSPGDTWIKLISVDPKRKVKTKSSSLPTTRKPFPSRSCVHPWTSVCNLRVDRDTTVPGLCSVRKTKHRSNRTFIFLPRLLVKKKKSAPSTPRVVVMSPFFLDPGQTLRTGPKETTKKGKSSHPARSLRRKLQVPGGKGGAREKV